MGYMGVFEELFEYLGENRDVDLGERKDWGLVCDTKFEATVDHQQFDEKNNVLIEKCT